MKRSPLPPRRSPLRSVAPLRRTGLARVVPLSAAPQHRARQRDTGPARAVRDLVRERAGDRCELCWSTDGLQVHHRRPRASGGTSDPATNSPANLLLLCVWCHADIEARRALALANGHLIHQGHDPAAVPVLLLAHGRVRLCDDGSISPTPPDRSCA